MTEMPSVPVLIKKEIFILGRGCYICIIQRHFLIIQYLSGNLVGFNEEAET
eukprot:CAMPEP_0172185654 /NCGR_PEP_ID=MMETSP1050-20130122/20298_1 /TAXON_ID=233186 /ORGANISM="Cryptomonas curvata, Strain CCAP979/52" /LENGTH=50 /DNA_ID=CAMNT_0012859681 /DNA_START=463 /DNA_END=615 /DNA_ORIENTATION=+